METMSSGSDVGATALTSKYSHIACVFETDERFDFWTVDRSGTYSEQCVRGRSYARNAIEAAAHDPQILSSILKAVVDRGTVDGVEVGFFAELSEAVVNADAVAVTPLLAKRYAEAKAGAEALLARERNLKDFLRAKGLRLRWTPERSWYRREHGVGYMVMKGNRVLLGAKAREYDATLEEAEAFAGELED